MPRRRVFEDGRRRPLAAERSIVARINPQAAGAGLGLGQNRHGRVVDVEAFGRQNMLAQRRNDGIERADAGPDPIGQR